MFVITVVILAVVRQKLTSVVVISDALVAACRLQRCPENSLCINLPLESVCVCVDGFRDSNGSCVAVTTDGCSDFCLNGGTCFQTEMGIPKCMSVSDCHLHFCREHCCEHQ